MGAYSPLLSTYGVRVDQLLETVPDFVRYHGKLNKKLQKLRHKCQLTNRDSKRYRIKDKYKKINSDDYDKKSKLYAVIILLHAERDLALVEVLKLRARQRGKLKKSESKVIGTRLKRVIQTCERLVSLTQNEPHWSCRVQYLVYYKLVRAEYLTYGKQLKHTDGKRVSSELALCFAALDHLVKSSIITDGIVDLLHAKYEYTLKQNADKAFSSGELHNFILEEVQLARRNGDEMVNLLIENGYEPQEHIATEDTSLKEIQWRTFTAKIYDHQVEKLIANSKSVTVRTAADFDIKLLKWQQALEIQQSRIVSQNENENDDDDLENDQILLAYIKYNVLFTSILRDTYLFNQLWQQWFKLDSAMSPLLTKCKEIERIVRNLQKYLQDIMELPGVYQDDELMGQLELSKLYFQLSYTSGCLGSLYRLKGQFLESLALHVDAHHKLEQKLGEMGSFQHALVPPELLSPAKIESLQQLIISGWKSVVALAEYQRYLQLQGQHLYQSAVIEKLDASRILPSDVKISNIFPLRPKLRPVMSKPTLFDLAFNYMDYTSNNRISFSSAQVEGSDPIPSPALLDNNRTDMNKKRGFLGLFRH